MPVEPAVYSTTVPPGASVPAAAAPRIIASATRSFMLPVGLADSSFTTTRACPGGTTLRKVTSGVLPIALRIPPAVVGSNAGTLVRSAPRAAFDAAVADEPGTDPPRQPHDDRGQERRLKPAREVESRQDPGHESDHRRVQHQEEQPEGENGDRQGEDE